MTQCRPTLWLILTLACTLHFARAQQPIIESLSRNGELVTTNLPTGVGATIEWAPTATGPWTNVWTGLRDVMASSNGVIQVDVPMFYRVRISNPDPARLVWIPPGTFMMGSPSNEVDRGNYEKWREVTISHGFHMGKYHVTQGEYLEVVGSNPSYWTNGAVALGSGGTVTNQLRHPVEQVSWIDATNYCALLTERERSAGRLQDGYAYRLPTEAEWEYACRAGTRTAFYHGIAMASGLANFDGKFEYISTVGTVNNPAGVDLGRTTEVGSLGFPNAWGLYEMDGNVYQWCRDWYKADLPDGPRADPVGPSAGITRVFRGGGYVGRGVQCRSAVRNSQPPKAPESHLGFRVVVARSLP